MHGALSNLIELKNIRVEYGTCAGGESGVTEAGFGENCDIAHNVADLANDVNSGSQPLDCRASGAAGGAGELTANGGLRGVNLTVAEGEFVLLTGGSGCGSLALEKSSPCKTDLSRTFSKVT